MHTATTTTYPTPATLDAGRQPFSYTPFNTPNTKTKTSVRGKKRTADDVFCPQATSTPRKIPFNRAKPSNSEASDDDDVPLAVVMKLHSAPLARRPSTVKRVGVVRRRRVEVDDEDLPLSKVKERLMRSDVRPTVKRVLRRQPPTKPKPVVQTVRNLAPTSTPMTCIVPNCPYDWHVHVNTISL